MPSSTANALGNITVRVAGFGGNVVGLSDVNFEGDTIGNAKITTTRGQTSPISRGVNAVNFTATNSIGTLTFDGDVVDNQVSGLIVVAGGKLAGLTVKSKAKAGGVLLNSRILAGQSLTMGGSDQEI